VPRSEREIQAPLNFRNIFLMESYVQLWLNTPYES
jgi:hypothetical protein